ncbi:hypothetical protein KAT92_06415 [Candidatus Babeliales bacterium]|nr:hypothetical protein [Candidatus Babeliales bacterium]
MTDEERLVKHLEDAFNDVQKTLSGRSTGYKVQPVTYMPIEDLIAQIAIKAERARQSTTIDKQIEETIDIVGYSLWLLARLKSDIHDHRQLQVERPDNSIVTSEEATVSKVET